MTRACLAALLLFLAPSGSSGLWGQGGPSAPGRAGGWSWVATAGLGALLGPGELARGTNAPGAGENLILRLGDGAAFGLATGRGTRLVELDARLVFGAAAPAVQNEAGVLYPNHASRPVFWNGALLLFPFGFTDLTVGGRRVRPFAGAGIGGLVLTADLDNVEGQTLYHAFLRTVEAGLRIGSGRRAGEPGFVELRIVRHRTWRSGPLHAVRAVSATLGIGLAW
jgi:hypothetical protein